jgi:AcrR family transcriptional regulator
VSNGYTETLDRRRAHTDDELLDAARAEFAARGYEAASMDGIAARAGSTKPTLYRRFTSKRGIYERAVQRDADALLTHLFEAYAAAVEEPVPRMVAASMDAYFGFFEARPDSFPLLFASGRAEPAVVMAEQVLDRVTDRLAEMTAAVLRRGGHRPPEATRLLAAMLLGIAHHGVAALRRDPELGIARARRLATDLAISGLRGLPAGLRD